MKSVLGKLWSAMWLKGEEKEWKTGNLATLLQPRLNTRRLAVGKSWIPKPESLLSDFRLGVAMGAKKRSDRNQGTDIKSFLLWPEIGYCQERLESGEQGVKEY